MSGSYDNSSVPNYITMAAGGEGAAGTGAHTVAVLWAPQNFATFQLLLAVNLLASTTQVRTISENSGMFGAADFSSGYTTGVSAGNWYLEAITKPAGSAHYRGHYWAYNSGGTGTMTHGEATGAGNHSDGSAITETRIGAGDVNTNGLIAVVGIWTSALADASLDTLVSVNLSAWAALSPAALFSLQNWTGSTGAADVVGTSTFSSVTGTVSSGANPPSFDFTLASTNATVTLLPSQANVTIHP